MVFGLFRALKNLCQNSMNSKIESHPIFVFSFNKVEQTISRK